MALVSDPAEPSLADAAHWPQVRAWLQAHPGLIADDRALMEELGLRPHAANVVEFGPAALTRLEAAATRAQDARQRIEAVAQANFAAQTQTHVLVLDLMEARGHSDLARRLDASARTRFDLAGAAIALERPGGVPFGWRGLEPGAVDRRLGPDGIDWLGVPSPSVADLFGDPATQVRSVALIRIAPHVGPEGQARDGLCLFGSHDPDGFTAEMGRELVAHIARVVERMAERWPILN